MWILFLMKYFRSAYTPVVNNMNKYSSMVSKIPLMQHGFFDAMAQKTMP
jgi:hypothetical protein